MRKFHKLKPKIKKQQQRWVEVEELFTKKKS